MFDILILNGTVIDGTGGERFSADVAVTDGRIVEVGGVQNAEAAASIDAAGLIVAPGFIDVHNHSDGWLLKTPHLAPKTTQGFTTEVLMADGVSYAPVNERTVREWMFYLRGLDGLRMDEYTGWRTIEDFLNQIDGRNVQNAAAHIPYANVRSMACGFGRDRVDDFRMRQITLDICRAMDAGAVGISTGIDYIVQCFATTDELVEACAAMAAFNGLYVTHMRYKKGLLAALREAVEIARRAGVRLHVSHLKAPTPQLADEILEYIDGVARHEVDLSFDVYPYQPGSTMLNYLLPYEVWEDGPLAALGKLNDPAVRELLACGIRDYRLNADRLRLAWVPGKENSRFQGRTLGDYIEASGLSPEEAVCNLLIEERLAPLMVVNEGDDEQVHPFLQHDLFMLGTDGIYTEDGPVHPRMFGSTGRMLGPMIRDLKLFTLEDAVHRMSGRPAERFGLKDRGRIQTGAIADLVVFDADAIIDHATYENPRQFTTGVEHVLVGGTPIIRNGEPVEFEAGERLPGRAVRRSITRGSIESRDSVRPADGRSASSA